MISWSNESLLLATGLSLRKISEILITSSTEKELLQNLEEEGSKYATRYKIIKKYQNLKSDAKQKLPIVIILAGIPGIGKTALAHELSLIFNIRIVIGGDAIRSVLRSIVPKKEHEEFFSSVYNAWKKFGEKSIENIVKGYRSQSKILNSAIQYMIADRALRDGESMIIESLHFLPSQFDKEILSHPSIIPIIMEITNEDLYAIRLNERVKFTHLRSSSKRLLEQKENYLEIQNHQVSDSKIMGVKIIDFSNFNEGLDNTLDYIFERIDILNKKQDYKDKISIIEKINKEREENQL